MHLTHQWVVFQGCSGAGTRWNAVPANILEPERHGAPANIIGHRWNANTEVFWQIMSHSLGWPSISLFSGPNCPQTRDLASKISKKFPGVAPPDSLSGRGWPPPAPTPSTATRRARWLKLPRCWYLSLGNRSQKSNFTTTPWSSSFSGLQIRRVYFADAASWHVTTVQCMFMPRKFHRGWNFNGVTI